MLATPDLSIHSSLPRPAASGCPPFGQVVPPDGCGCLEVDLVDGLSSVVTCSAQSPLKLLTPRSRGRAAWILQANHGGGLVGGDAVDLTVRVGHAASAYLGSQAETKVYRPLQGTGARQSLLASLGEGAVFALLPDPVSPYAGSRYDQVQRFDLSPGASLAVLDAVTAGRAARGERWAFARYRSRNEVRVGGRLLLADALRLESTPGPALPGRLAGLEIIATIVLIGPAFAAAARELLAEVEALPAEAGAGVLEAASPLADGVFLRLCARTVEDGMTLVRKHLSFLAASLDGDPLLRRP